MTSLPQPSTPFVGRTDELTSIARLLADPACRLLTLVGPGGIGKTRLAIQAAVEQQPQLKHGVCFVPLAPVNAPDQIAPAIASALETTVMSAPNPVSQLLHYLRGKQMLLVIDNFEHLLEGVGLLTELLQACPSLKLLVTSREKLNVQEEWVLALAGLSFPAESTSKTLENYSAVQLFVERARRMQAHFSLDDNAAAVQAICQQVEGLPLALELAATWLRVLSCQQILERMTGSFDFLTTPLRNVPERHRSLRVVFEQSWRLLSQAEQTVLANLSVFRGGFDLEAAEQVAGASLHLLAGLVDKSLVQLAPNRRYNLHELLRQYMADKLLETGQASAAIQRHVEYFLKLAESAEAHNFGREQVAWYDRLEADMDNLRAAMTWGQESKAGLRMAAALGWFFSERAYWKEGLEWLDQAVAANPGAPPVLRAKALHSSIALAGLLEEPERAEDLCEKALQLAQSVDDRWNIAWTLAHQGNFGTASLDEAASLLEESLALFRDLDDPMGIAHTLIRRGWMAFGQRDYAYMRQLVEEAHTRAIQAGDQVIHAWATYDLGRAAWFGDHDLPQAKRLLESSLALFRDAGLGIGFQNPTILLANIEQVMGNHTRAQMLYKAALNLEKEQERESYVGLIISGLASVARSRGEFQRAGRLMGAAGDKSLLYQNLIPVEIFTFSSDVEAVRAELGEPAFTQAWEAGRAMTKLQVIAYALEDGQPPPQPTNGAHPPLLNRRELEILTLLADGLSNREMADRLSYTVGTVKWYLNEIYSKLDVHNRTQAVAAARQRGLLN